MSQIKKCYKVTVVLTYWEASGEVSELSYKSLLFISSKRSYCMLLKLSTESKNLVSTFESGGCGWKEEDWEGWLSLRYKRGKGLPRQHFKCFPLSVSTMSRSIAYCRKLNLCIWHLRHLKNQFLSLLKLNSVPHRCLAHPKSKGRHCQGQNHKSQPKRALFPLLTWCRQI